LNKESTSNNSTHNIILQQQQQQISKHNIPVTCFTLSKQSNTNDNKNNMEINDEDLSAMINIPPELNEPMTKVPPPTPITSNIHALNSSSAQINTKKPKKSRVTGIKCFYNDDSADDNPKE